MLAAPALGPAFGQGAFPNKPLKVIVPYPPGGGTDGLGRITAQFLSEKLGQPIVVQNIGGASGTLGSDTVRRADPDGYTLLFNASLFALGKTVVPTCPYDPQTDFRPIAQAGEAPLVLLVNLSVPGTDYASTVAAIAKDPKKYFFALSSGGSAGHIATLEFLQRTGLKLDTILYKGTAPANADLLSGSVQLFMDPWTVTLPLATSGRARALFVTSKERTPLAPNVPTSAEAGLKDFNLSSWYGLWAPKATPDPVVNRLAAAMAEVSKDPAFVAKTTSLGIVPTARGPMEFAAFIKQEVETNTALLKDANYKPE
ncbi:MAG: tripartite tricarboxylate transporter substrate binding protein [Reyranella sp.]|nr:tripartite tricarboxylate transporter substrate binding protein [Reyranella sp.]